MQPRRHDLALKEKADNSGKDKDVDHDNIEVMATVLKVRSAN